MKKIALLVAVLIPLAAHAQSNASSSTTTSSASGAVSNPNNAQAITFNSTTPGSTRETLNDVSAPMLGAYASSFSPLNCGSTSQGGFAFAGFSIAGGTSTELSSCLLLTTASETSKATTVEPDPAVRKAELQAAQNMRCMVSDAVYDAYIAAGMLCGTKPKGYKPTQAAVQTAPAPKLAMIGDRQVYAAADPN